MKSESKRILYTIQRKALNPITDKPMFRTSDEVLEEALEIFYQHLKRKKVVWSILKLLRSAIEVKVTEWTDCKTNYRQTHFL